MGVLVALLGIDFSAWSAGDWGQVLSALFTAVAVLAAWGFGSLSIHDARHTYASLMIAAGVNAKALSQFLGHATIAITFDLYGHLLPGAEDEAAGLLDAFLARQFGGAEVEQTAASASMV